MWAVEVQHQVKRTLSTPAALVARRKALFAPNIRERASILVRPKVVSKAVAADESAPNACTTPTSIIVPTKRGRGKRTPLAERSRAIHVIQFSSNEWINLRAYRNRGRVRSAAGSRTTGVKSLGARQSPLCRAT